MRRTKILIYGFGPYGGFGHNITQAILRRLGRRRGLATRVFTTRFSRGMFLTALRQHAPQIVIGLGQDRTGRKLRLERKAVNRMGRRGEVGRPIDPKGPAQLFVNLHLPETTATTVAYDAGSYVCNFSMYWMLRACRQTGCRFAFIHVPRHYDVAAATAYLRLAVRVAKGLRLGPGPSGYSNNGRPRPIRSHRA